MYRLAVNLDPNQRPYCIAFHSLSARSTGNDGGTNRMLVWASRTLRPRMVGGQHNLMINDVLWIYVSHSYFDLGTRLRCKEGLRRSGNLQ